MINPRAIFLDLDGTLADSLQVMHSVYQNFVQKFSIPPSDAEFQALNGPPLNEVVRRLKVSHQLKGEESKLLAMYHNLIDTAYVGVVPCLGAIELLRKAKENGCLVGIVTSNTLHRTQAWLARVTLSNLIDCIVSSDDLLLGKPHPEPYLKALTKASCNASEIIVVEDSVQGVQSAVSAGLKTFMLVDKNSVTASRYGAVPIESLVHLIDRLW